MHQFNPYKNILERIRLRKPKYKTQIKNYVPVIAAVGCKAIQIAESLPLEVKENSILLGHHADKEATVEAFQRNRNSWRGTVMHSYDLDKGGCGKCGPDGEEIIRPLLSPMITRENQIFNEWRIQYGIEPRIVIEPQFCGGTGTGTKFTNPNWAVNIVNPSIHFEILSLSRTDYEMCTGNAVIAFSNQYPNMVKSVITGNEIACGKAPIVIPFDQNADAAKIDETIKSTITTLVALSLSAGLLEMDGSDIDKMVMLSTIGTMESVSRDLNTKEITIDDATRMIQNVSTRSRMDFLKISAFDHKNSTKNAFSVISDKLMTKETISGATANVKDKESKKETLIEGIILQKAPLIANAIRFGKIEAAQVFFKRYFPPAIERSMDYIHEMQKRFPKYKDSEALNTLLNWYHNEQDLKNSL